MMYGSLLASFRDRSTMAGCAGRALKITRRRARRGLKAIINSMLLLLLFFCFEYGSLGFDLV